MSVNIDKFLEATDFSVEPLASVQIEDPEAVDTPDIDAFLETTDFSVSESPLSTSLLAVEDRAPDQAADTQKLSKKLDVAPDIIEQDLPGFKKDTAKQDMDEMLYNSIGSRIYLSDPNNMAVSQDDVSNLKDTEDIITRNIKGVGKSALKQVGLTPFKFSEFIYNTAALGADTVGSIQDIIQLPRQGIEYLAGIERPDIDFKPTESIRDWALSQAQSLEDLRESIDVLQLPAELKDKRLIENLDFLLNPEWLTYNVGEAASSLVPMLAAAYASGGSTLVGGLVGGLQEASSLYKQLIDEGVDHDRAEAAALSFLPVVSALNKIGLKSVLGSKGTGSLLSSFGAFAKGGVVEGTTEYLEEPFQALFSSIAKEKTTDQTFEAIAQSFQNIDVIPGAFLMGGGTSVATYTAEIKRNTIAANRAETDQLLFEALDTAAGNSKTLGRLPDAYKSFVNTVIEESDGAVTSVFIDSELFQQTINESESIDQTTLDDLGITEKVNEAVLTGANVEIPIAEYAAHIAGTEASIALRQDVKFSDDGMTMREAEAYRQELNDVIAQQNEAIKDVTKVTEQLETERKVIYDAVYKDRIETGSVTKTAKADAEVFAAQVSAMAELYNVSPLKMWEQVQPKIVSAKFEPSQAQQASQEVKMSGIDYAPTFQKEGTDEIFTGEAKDAVLAREDVVGRKDKFERLRDCLSLL